MRKIFNIIYYILFFSLGLFQYDYKVLPTISICLLGILIFDLIIYGIVFRPSVIIGILLILSWSIGHNIFFNPNQLYNNSEFPNFVIVLFVITFYLGAFFRVQSAKVIPILSSYIIGSYLLVSLSFLGEIIKNGVISENRDISIFYSQDLFLKGPHIGMTSGLALAFIVFILEGKNIRLKIVSYFLIGTTVIINLLAQNRTPIYALILVIATLLFLKIIKNINLKEKKGFRLNIMKIITRFFVILIAFFLILYNFDTLLNTSGFQRYKEMGLESPRYEMWKYGVEQLILYPEGQFDMSQLLPEKYFHNIFLDFANSAGIIPLIFLLVFYGWCLFSFIKNIVASSLYYDTINKFIISLFIIQFITILIEPIFLANNIYFSFHLLLIGMAFVKLRKEEDS